MSTERETLYIDDHLIIIPTIALNPRTGVRSVIVQVYDRKKVTSETAVFQTLQEYDEFVERCLNPSP